MNCKKPTWEEIQIYRALNPDWWCCGIHPQPEPYYKRRVKINPMENKIMLEIPFDYFVEEGQYMIFSNEETKKYLDIPIVIQANSKEEAIEWVWKLTKSHLSYLETRSHQADKWELFRKGDWSHKGGKWFTFLGLHFYFRWGKQNKGGWFVPFTKLNIRFTNYWKLWKLK